MTFVLQISTLVRLDFFDFWRVRWVVAGLLSLHLADALIVLVVFDRLIPLDYIRFALPGVVASAVTMAALDQSRKVFWEFQARTHYYFRALPFRPLALVLARLIGAAVKAFTYSVGLVVPVAILGSSDTWRVTIAVVTILLVSVGIGALGIALGAMIREFSAWSATSSLLAMGLVTISTAFYPLHVVESVSPILSAVAMINPVSSLADTLRWAFSIAGMANLEASVIRSLLAILVFISLGGGLYRWAMTQGR